MRKFYLIDAKNKVLGRLATQIANILSGRTKVSFTPHKDEGDSVVVLNSDKVRVTGNKAKGKMYHSFSGYPGGITSISFEDQLAKDSTKLIFSAVYGMLPKNKLRKEMLKRLRIYKGAEHPHKIDVTL